MSAYQAPKITFKTFRDRGESNIGEKSLFDLYIETSTGINFPQALGFVDAWCIDQTKSQFLSPATYQGYVYSSVEVGLLQSSIPTLTDTDKLDSVNWLLNYYAAHSTTYSYGEMQAAIWTLMGSNYTLSTSLGAIDVSNVNALITEGLAHDGYVPDAGERIAVVVNPIAIGQYGYLGTGQPLIIPTLAAKLGDFVWNDLDADGLQETGEQGIAGATVKLVRDLDGDGFFTSANEVLATTTTDSNGAYNFKGLTPGLSYQVLFSMPSGYDAASPRQSDGIPASGINSDGLVSDVVVLAPGEYRATIDAGFYRYATLGDRLWIDSNGDGQQNDGATGISGQTVTLVGGGADGLIATTGDNTSATTVTGTDGYYQFTGLAPGVEYQVQFAKPAGSVYTGRDLGGDDTKDSDADVLTGRTQIVTLASGENNPTLDAGVYTPARLSGYVYQDAGNDGVRNAEPAIAGVTVTLSGTDTLGNAVSASTITNASGYYEFAGLPPGTYAVSETQPAGYLDGKDTAGSAGGSNAVNDRLSGIVLASGANSVENNFGELPPSSLAGFVYHDSNNDGSRTGETAIAGATVTLSGQDDLGHAVSASVLSAADGSYRFDNLRPGDYTLTETQPVGYLDGKDTLGTPGGTAGNDNFSHISLGSGVNGVENNFGELLPARLSGYVYQDAGNDGVRNAEPAIAGVTVTLSGTNDLGAAVTGTATTNASGYYEFTGLRPGTYAVSETQPAGYLDGKDTAGSAGGSNAVNDRLSGIVLVSGANSVENNFGELLPASLGDRLWVDSNGDGQQNDGATGIVGQTVTLVGGGADGLIATTGDNTSATTTTAADGYYQFTGLTSGVEYQVQFTKPAGSVYTGKDLGGDDAKDSDVSVTGLSQIVTLAQGENNTTIDAGVYAPASIGDRVWEDGNGNGRQDAGEPGIGGVTVRLFDCVTNALVATATTADGTGADPKGYYNFAGLPPGTYHVEFQTPSGYVVTTANVGANGFDLIDNDAATPNAGGNGYITGCYTLPSGGSETSVDGGFYRPASLGDRLWVDSNGDGQQNDGATGISGQTVTLVGGGADGLIATTGDNTSATTVTGTDGYYQFTGLAPGVEYQVQFAKPAGSVYTGRDLGGDDTKDSDADVLTGRTQIVTLASGENNPTLDAGVYTPARLSGYVYQDAGNDGVRNAEPAIAGVTVTLSGTDTLGNAVSASTITNASGYYEFAGLPPGTYAVGETQPAGYLDGRDTAGSAGGSNAVNDRLSGIVLASGANSVENNFGELPPARLSGYVYQDAGNDGVRNAEPAIAGVTVTLTGTNDLGAAVTGTAITGANGYYEFTGLRPGTYSVSETQPAGYLDGKDTAGSAGGSNAVNDRLSGIVLASGANSVENNFGELPPARLSGYVYQDAGNDGVRNSEPAIAGVTVTLTGTNDLGAAVTGTATTNASGYYEFTGLRPGTYAVSETQPAAYLDGKDTAGSAGGSNAVNDKLSGIVLVSGANSVENNFGELMPASLGDRLWLDANANGQQDAGEAGVAGQTVTLVGGGADRLISTAADNTTATTVTAADGSYAFTGLASGVQYQVQFAKPAGYVYTGKDIGADASDSDADTTTGKSQIVTLAQGENNTTIDAGIYTTASIGDKVWFDRNANGVQDTGEAGVANVTVKLLDAGGAVLATQTTDAGGNYLFANLKPGSYAIEFAPLAGYTFTAKDAGADGVDSDADPTTGRTVVTTLVSGEVDRSWDAGLTAVCRPVSFDFSGSSATDGTDGNSRSYTDALTGVSVTARAFSQDKGSNVWQTAFLGSYGGGLGVTDSSEGAGANNTHEIDNVGRNNYIVLQFSQEVMLDKAYLDAVVGDSDVQVWIGNSATTLTTMSNAVLSGMGYSEVDTTTLTTARWADLNDGGLRGNVVIVAADTTDATPDDYFKLDQVSVCALDYGTPVAKASIGNFVWEDANYNGVQDAGEAGIANVTVRLLNSAGTLLASTTTNTAGQYLFGNLNPADYKVQVVAPSGYYVTKQNQGSNDGVDSDIDAATGTAATTTLSAGENDLSWDAGLYRKASVGDKVWEDKNHNGLQDVGEPGVGGIKVQLLDAAGATLASTTTNTSGNYLFSNLNPGTYLLQFDKGNVAYAGINLNDWKWGVKNVGSNDAIDSDVAGDGVSKTNVTRTDAFTLVSGQNDLTRDATVTPLVIDLDGDGIRTVARSAGGATFDLFGNGTAVASGWIGAHDGFLAVDRNGNGRIDGIGELFGGTARGAGFARLAAYDSNGDGTVDRNDAGFDELRIWRDADGNHATDAGELMTLGQAGVASLAAAYVELPFLDGAGNLHLERSSATLDDGRAVSMNDVYFGVSADDAATADRLPTLSELLGDDRSLDGMLGGGGDGNGDGGAFPAAAGVDDAGLTGGDSAELLRTLTALSHAAAQPTMGG